MSLFLSVFKSFLMMRKYFADLKNASLRKALLRFKVDIGIFKLSQAALEKYHKMPTL